MIARLLWRLRLWRWRASAPLRVEHDLHNWHVLMDRWRAAKPRPPGGNAAADGDGR